MGLDRLVDCSTAVCGPRGAGCAATAGVPRRIVGLAVDWPMWSNHLSAVGLPPLAVATASASPWPVFAGSRQVARMTSSTCSPVLKQMIGIATIEVASRCRFGSRSSTRSTSSPPRRRHDRGHTVLQPKTQDRNAAGVGPRAPCLKSGSIVRQRIAFRSSVSSPAPQRAW